MRILGYREKMPIVRKRIYLGTYAVIDFYYKVTNSSPLTHRLTSKRLYFNYFKERLDHFYGTAMIPNYQIFLRKKFQIQHFCALKEGVQQDVLYSARHSRTEQSGVKNLGQNRV